MPVDIAIGFYVPSFFGKIWPQLGAWNTRTAVAVARLIACPFVQMGLLFQPVDVLGWPWHKNNKITNKTKRLSQSTGIMGY